MSAQPKKTTKKNKTKQNKTTTTKTTQKKNPRAEPCDQEAWPSKSQQSGAAFDFSASEQTLWQISSRKKKEMLVKSAPVNFKRKIKPKTNENTFTQIANSE